MINMFTHIISRAISSDPVLLEDIRDLLDGAVCFESALQCYFEDRMPTADGVAEEIIDAAIEHVDWEFLADEIREEMRND